jgi:tetratricopeptide (TPR) repeat protein
VLADDDRGSRTEKVRALYRRRSGTAASTRARLEGLLDPGERDVASASEQEGLQAVAKASPPAPTGSSPTKDEPAPADPGDAKATAATAGDAALAAREVKAGQLALKKGELAEAESRFHRALEARRNDADALAGLAQIRFERGDYDKAVRFAMRAADAAPRSARIRILLGDAHFKVLAYDAARRAYERAQELGSSVADERLARLDKLTSKPK